MSSQPEHLVTMPDEVAGNGNTQCAGGAGKQNLHVFLL
jgi:hypothetical protein